MNQEDYRQRLSRLLDHPVCLVTKVALLQNFAEELRIAIARQASNYESPWQKELRELQTRILEHKRKKEALDEEIENCLQTLDSAEKVACTKRLVHEKFRKEVNYIKEMEEKQNKVPDFLQAKKKPKEAKPAFNKTITVMTNMIKKMMSPAN